MKQIKIFWSEDEEKVVSSAFCAKRLADPFAPNNALLEKAIEGGLPEHRRRSVQSWAQFKDLRRRIASEWREIQQVASPAPPPEPELRIIEIERAIERT